MLRWFAFGLMATALAAAVAWKGGVEPSQWQWTAVCVSLAACVFLLKPSGSYGNPTTPKWGLAATGLLAAWMLLQLVPFPGDVVALLSPHRWEAAVAARKALGLGPDKWLAISVAPPATFEGLLHVIPAIAMFVAASEMGRWLGRRIWWGVAPIIAIAFVESVLGLLQYYLMRTDASSVASATGTYVNRNHFAGLLELAFPLAAMWAAASWRRGSAALASGGGPTLWTSILVGIAMVLFAGILASLSRMGFLSSLVAILTIALAYLATTSGSPGSRRWLRWGAPVVGFAALSIFIVAASPAEMIQRFADTVETDDMTTGGRLGIWKDSAALITHYQWTGCGLGAFERGLYPFKTVAPLKTVDFAHNDYLQILAELGIGGFVLTMCVAGWIVWSAGSAVAALRGTRKWELAVGLLAAIVAFGFHSLADFNLYIPANALTLAWLAGLAVSPALRSE